MVLPTPQSAKHPKHHWRSLVVILVLGLIVEIGARLGAEMLWFQELGYLPMYLLRLGTQGILGVVVFTMTTVYLLWNLALAQRWKSPDPSPDRRAISSTRRPLTLRWLLPLTLSLSLLAIAILVHYGRMAMSQWYIDPDLPTVVPPAPVLFRPEFLLVQPNELARETPYPWFVTLGEVKSLSKLARRLASFDRNGFNQSIESLVTNSFNFYLPQF